MVCAFFGHRDAPQDLEPLIYKTLIDLVETKDVKMFYVGNNGAFDRMVRKNLKILKNIYSIKYAVVLSYLPVKSRMGEDFSDTLFPEELERVSPRYAILKRNEWMLQRADYVVTYVRHSLGGAARFQELAKAKGKNIIRL